MLLFAPADAENNLGLAPFEVHFQRDERQPFFKRAMGESLHLPPVHQEFSGTLRHMIESIGLDILRNIATDEPNFVLFDLGIRLVQGYLAVAQAFYFASHQDDAAFQRIEHQIVVPGFAILRNDLVVWTGWGRPLFLGGFAQSSTFTATRRFDGQLL